MPEHGRAHGDTRLPPDVWWNDRSRSRLHRRRQARQRSRCAGEPAVRRSVPPRRSIPLDQRIELNEAGSPPTLAPQIEWKIVGIYHTINNSQELGDVSRPEVMLPFWQSPWLDAAVAVRTAGDPDAVRQDVAAAGADVSIRISPS